MAHQGSACLGTVVPRQSRDHQSHIQHRQIRGVYLGGRGNAYPSLCCPEMQDNPVHGLKTDSYVLVADRTFSTGHRNCKLGVTTLQSYEPAAAKQFQQVDLQIL